MEKPVDNKPRKRIVIEETDSEEEEEKEGQFNIDVSLLNNEINIHLSYYVIE